MTGDHQGVDAHRRAGIDDPVRQSVRGLGARHEQGHVDYAVNHRLAVLRAIRNATCSTANAAALRQLDLIRKHDVAYDKTTNHGATQGARFP